MGSRRTYRTAPAFGERTSGKGRLIVAVIMIAFALISYYSSKEYNPVTGEDQYIALTPHQEIAMGLQAVPEMTAQYGGAYADPQYQQYLDDVGFRIVNSSAARDTEWQFEFTLLADPQTINAFALPGGPVFITKALFDRLETEGQLAGVLGHEIGHVVARHSAQRIAKANLTEGITGAVVVASGDERTAQMAVMVGQMINMKYGREDELQSDMLGVQFMVDAGYDPRSLIGVMKILEETSGGSPPEFMSTHPNPGNRAARIEEAIQQLFPNGVPDGLIP
ncbi:MAG: M48 family metalloprotease [Anaerolineales bacterium]|nr:M48 family metalloprotease [Anaerolineales bacterium]